VRGTSPRFQDELPLTPTLSPAYRGEGVSSSPRPRMTHVFAPPNPSDVFSDVRSAAGLDAPVDRFSPANSTSSARTLAHGGTTPSRSAIADRISSTAPAPPRVWPRLLLKATTGMRASSSPNARENAAN